MELTEAEKRKFLETALSHGREAAKAEALKGKVFSIEQGQQTEVFGESLTAEEMKQRYPEAVVIDLLPGDSEL